MKDLPMDAVGRHYYLGKVPVGETRNLTPPKQPPIPIPLQLVKPGNVRTVRKYVSHRLVNNVMDGMYEE